MTSKLTNEQLIEELKRRISVTEKYPELEQAQIDASIYKIALAAMDSEPVAIVEPSDYVTAAQLVGEGPVRKAVHELYEGALRIGDKLYRHAQQPVVPDKMTYQDGVLFVLNNDMSSIERGTVAMRAWNACRAAMLQESQKSAGISNNCRSNENMQDMQAGNSPVIPDGYVMVPVEPNGDMLAAAQDAYGETDGDIASTLRAAMLAAAPQEVPDGK